MRDRDPKWELEAAQRSTPVELKGAGEPDCGVIQPRSLIHPEPTRKKVWSCFEIAAVHGEHVAKFAGREMPVLPVLPNPVEPQLVDPDSPEVRARYREPNTVRPNVIRFTRVKLGCPRPCSGRRCPRPSGIDFTRTCRRFLSRDRISSGSAPFLH